MAEKLTGIGGFAAYLTLTLHLYGLGSCVVQSPLIWNEKWDSQRREYGIDKDEQLVCLLAVGNLKDECLVPRSHRLSEENICKFL